MDAITPTKDTYAGFYAAFAHFNRTLFNNELPDCMITMQRKGRTLGYFSPDRFGYRRGNGSVDEIALNPQTFAKCTDQDIISTLVHEQVHQWQAHFGKPSRGGYHNRPWANKMVEIGLMPSDTAAPGGKQTGPRVSHYIVDGGAFDREWQKLEASGYRLDYQDPHGPKPRAPVKLKTKYSCPECDINAWGKPELRLFCAGQDDQHQLCEMEALH